MNPCKKEVEPRKVVQFDRWEFGIYVLYSDGELYYRKNQSHIWEKVKLPDDKKA